MRRFLYILFCISIFSACSDKVELSDDQAKTFNKFYGNSGSDEACEIRELADGSFFIFGTIQTAGRGTDMALIKTDKFGNEQWTKTFGRNFDDKGGSLDIADNGNIIMVATSNNEGTIEGDVNHTDILMVEVDQSGSEVRRKIFEGIGFEDNEEANCILYDHSTLGGYVIAGSSDKAVTFQNFIGDDETDTTVTNAKFTKNLFFVRVYDEDGIENVNISNTGLEGNDEVLSGLTIDNEEKGFLFTGSYTKDGLSTPFIFSLTNRNEGVQTFILFSKIDLNGPGTGNRIIKTSTGYAITGTFKSGSNDVIYINKVDEGFKVSLLDDLLTIVRNGSVRSYSLSFNPSNSNFLVGGSTNISTGGGFDHYIAEMSGEGNVLWEQSFGGSGTEESFAITRTNDGGYVLAGYSGFEGNSLINVIKTDNLGNLNP